MYLYISIHDCGTYKHYNIRFVSLHIHFYGKNTKENHLSTLTFIYCKLYIRSFNDLAIVLSMLNYVVIHLCDSMCFFEWKQICACFFIVCLYMYCHWRSIKKGGLGSHQPVNPATFLCLSQAKTRISNVIC